MRQRLPLPLFLYYPMKTLSQYITPLLILASLLGACNSNKSPDKLSDEEKLAVIVPGEQTLTDEEKIRQRDARTNILEQVNQGNAAEKAIETAMQEAREMLSDTDFQTLKTAQDLWMRQGRGTDINELIQKGEDAKSAYTKSSERRADKIREQMNRAILVDTSNGYQGYFRTTDGRSLEIYQMPDDTLTVTIRSQDPAFVIATQGKLNDTEISLTSLSDEHIRLVMKPVNDDLLEISMAPDFEAKTLGQFATIITAQYARVKKGELNVFAF